MCQRKVEWPQGAPKSTSDEVVQHEHLFQSCLDEELLDCGFHLILDSVSLRRNI